MSVQGILPGTIFYPWLAPGYVSKEIYKNLHKSVICNFMLFITYTVEALLFNLLASFCDI